MKVCIIQPIFTWKYVYVLHMHVMKLAFSLILHCDAYNAESEHLIFIRDSYYSYTHFTVNTRTSHVSMVDCLSFLCSCPWISLAVTARQAATLD